MTGSPPSLDGALHDKTTELSPAAPLTAVGADATVAGVTGAEGTLLPAPLGSEGGMAVPGGAVVAIVGSTSGGVAGGENGSPVVGLMAELGVVVVGGVGKGLP